MLGGSPGGVAENGTRSGKVSFDLLFMRLLFPNLPSCLPSLAVGLVPAGHHYYEGSDFCQYAGVEPLRQPPFRSRPIRLLIEEPGT